MKLKKMIRIIVLRVLVIVTMCAIYLSLTPTAFATNHQESNIHGFQANQDVYNISWGSRRTLNVFRFSQLQGTISTYIGVARSKAPLLSSGKYVTTIMTRSIINPKLITVSRQVLWWTETDYYYGQTNELKYAIDFDGYAELMDVSPKNQPTSNTYSIGVNAGINASSSNGGTVGGSLGVSASQTFVASALNITNLSDTSVDFASTRYSYPASIFRWDWERNSYGHYESEQKAAYSVASSVRNYVPLVISASFTYTTQTPNYWQNFSSSEVSNQQTVYIYI